MIIIAISAVSCKMIYEINKFLGKHTKVVNTSQFKTISGKLAIKNINVLSENSELMIPNQTVLINESTIISIGDAVPIPNDYNIIDGANHFFHDRVDELTTHVDAYLETQIPAIEAASTGN